MPAVRSIHVPAPPAALVVTQMLPPLEPAPVAHTTQPEPCPDLADCLDHEDDDREDHRDRDLEERPEKEEQDRGEGDAGHR